MDLKKLKKWQEWVRLILTGTLVMLAAGLIGPIIPAIFDFGVQIFGVALSVGMLLTAGVAYFLAEMIVGFLKLK